MARITEIDLRNSVETDPNLDVASFVLRAEALVDRVEACAIKRGVPLTEMELKNIEILIAAHYYTLRAPQLQSKSTSTGTGSASGSFQLHDFLDEAMRADPSGCLASIVKGQRASGAWLGKPPSRQTAYADRR